MPPQKGTIIKSPMEKTYGQNFSTTIPVIMKLLQLAAANQEKFQADLRKQSNDPQISPVLADLINREWDQAVADGLIDPEADEWKEVARQAFVKTRLVHSFDAGSIPDDQLNPLKLAS